MSRPQPLEPRRDHRRPSGTRSAAARPATSPIRPDNPNIVYAGSYQGVPDPLRPPHRAAARHHRLARGVLRLGREGLQVPLPVDLADAALAARPEHALPRRQRRLPLDATRARAGRSISPDLTRNDPTTLEPSGGADHQGQHRRRGLRHGLRLRRVAARSAGVLWAGSDDGLVHVSRDGGADLGERHAAGPAGVGADLASSRPRRTTRRRAYLAATRYKHDDFQPYLYKTSDYGTDLDARSPTASPRTTSPASIREDPDAARPALRRHRDGVYVSFDDGANWQPAAAATCRSCRSTTW